MTYEAELRREAIARRARFASAGRFPMEQFAGVKDIPRFVPDEPIEIAPVPPPPVQPDFYEKAWALLQEDRDEFALASKARMSDVVRAVLSYFANISKAEFLSDRRKARLVRPRHIAMYLCKEKTKASYPQIGQYLGGRDHTTVLYGVAKVAKQLLTDPELAHDVAWIERFLDGEAP